MEKAVLSEDQIAIIEIPHSIFIEEKIIIIIMFFSSIQQDWSS